MNERKLTFTELALFAGTRFALGIGAGLLLSRRMNNDQRKAAGLALMIVGAATTIPLAIGFARRGKDTEPRMMQVA